MNHNKEILKTVLGCALLWASYWLLDYSSDLWLEKDGFWWSALVLLVSLVDWSNGKLNIRYIHGCRGYSDISRAYYWDNERSRRG